MFLTNTLKLPIGNVVMFSNFGPEEFYVIEATTPLKEYSNHIEVLWRYRLLPKLTSSKKYEFIALDTDVDLSKYLGSMSDEFVMGDSWRVKDIEFGVSVFDSKDNDLQLSFLNGLPGYANLKADYFTEYQFVVAGVPFIDNDSDDMFDAIDFYLGEY